MISILAIQPGSTLPAPCSKDEFREHLLDLHLMQLRMLSFITTDEKAAAVLPRPVERGPVFFDPDHGPTEFNLRYEDFRQSSFFRAMNCMYDFAYAGLIDESYEAMGDETSFMWAAALVRDLAASRVANCWDAFGTSYQVAAAVLLKVVETAAARAVLEGFEAFDVVDNDDNLTVRQLALLAGMEEMTIRSAANPKKPNALKVHTTEAGTRISAEVAKAWLIAKGRYVTPSRHWGDDEIDLTKKSFRSADDVLMAIHERLSARWVQLDDAGRSRLTAELQSLQLPFSVRTNGAFMLALEPEQLRDIQSMKHLAVALDFAPDLFVLRIREALANEDLQRVLNDIQAAVQAAKRQS